MLFIIMVYFDLVVAQEPIQERHAFEPACVVDHDVGDKKRDLVFREHLIAVPEVDANPDLPVLFTNRNNIGNLI